MRAWLPYLRYGVALLLFGVIFLFIVRPLMAMLAESSKAESLETQASVSALPSAVGADVALPNVEDRAQIIEMARKNPDTTAVVVKQWLKSPT